MLWKQEYHNKRYMNFAMTRTSNWKEIYRELRLVEYSEEASAKITSEHLSREAKQKYRVDSDG